ncbi:MAG TPA: G1 family glutamic endopeptidase [Acidimicrobiales bacterium]|nr:G1 family glutamic endopeptidase [Acidimicrobiales bacterium]
MTRLAGHGPSTKVRPAGNPGSTAPVFRLSNAARALLGVLAFFCPATPASAKALGASAMSNWSGYGLAGSGFTGVTGTFNVPTPTNSASCFEDTAVWVGVDGLGNHDLLQAGIAEIGFAQTSPLYWPSAGFPGLICPGRAKVYAWWEDLPSAAQWVNLPVQVGDSVTVSMFKMSPGWWALAVHDLTAKRSFLLIQPYAGPQTSVEWVVEAPQVIGLLRDPVPFSAVRFRNLGAQGEVRDLERFIPGSATTFASRPNVVGSTGQLLRSGFLVH